MVELFTMAKEGTVGKAIATAYVKDEKDIPDYEFPDSGHVKVNLTASDVAMLDGAPSVTEMRSRSITSPSRSNLSGMDKEIIQSRLLSTMAVLISFGLICILLSCLARYAMAQNAAMVLMVGALAFAVAMLARDWYRLHGEKLTRELKALLNVSSMLRSFDTFTLDFLGISKRLKFHGKYVFTSEGPAINEAIPRTPESSSPPVSPSRAGRNSTKRRTNAGTTL